MKNITIVFAALLICSLLSAGSKQELSDYYTSIEYKLITNIKSISISQTAELYAELINLSITSDIIDYIDSAIIHSEIIEYNNDTLDASIKMITNERTVYSDKDIFSTGISEYTMESFNMYSGHNLNNLLSDSIIINKHLNGSLTLHNINSRNFIDSILLNSDKMPVRISSNTYLGNVNIEINNYISYFGYLFIPDDINVYLNDKLFMTIETEKVKVELK